MFLRHFRWLGALTLTALLLCDARAAMAGAARAMAQWAMTVAPALLPFAALMPLLTCGAAARAYERLLGRPLRAVLDLPGAAAVAMVAGMVAGAPAGALAARDVAARAGMTRGQLKRLAAAATGFSPAFLVGGVGEGLMGSPALGWKLVRAQLLTQLSMALLLRWTVAPDAEPVAPITGAPSGDGGSPVRAAVLSVATICGWMALFQSAAAVIAAHAGPEVAGALLCLLDAPSGARVIASLSPALEAAKPVLLAAVCGFGGACVAAQNLDALRGCGIRAGFYVRARLLAAAINAGWMALLIRLAPGGGALLRRVSARPFEAAALAAALLVLPALARMRKSIS